MANKPPDGGIELVQLQRQRLYTQVQVQNEQIKQLEEVAATADKRRTDYEEVTLLLRRFWDRLCDDLIHLCKQAIPSENDIKLEGDKAAAQPVNGLTMSDPFLLALASSDHSLADGVVKQDANLQEEYGEVEKHLQARANETNALLRRLLELIHQQHAAADAAVQAFKGSGADEALRAAAAAAAADAAALRAEFDRCRAAERAAKDEVRHLVGQLGAERLRCRELDIKLVEGETELQMVRKRLIQAREGLASGSLQATSSMPGGASSAPSQAAPSQAATATANPTAASAIEAADTNMQIAELKKRLERVDAQLAKEIADHVQTKEELNEAQALIGDEAWVPKTKVYIQLTAEMDRIRKEDLETRNLVKHLSLERDQLDLHVKQLQRKLTEAESFPRMHKASEESRARLEAEKRQLIAELQHSEVALLNEKAKVGNEVTVSELRLMLNTAMQERDHLRQRCASSQAKDAKEQAAAEVAAALEAQKAAELASAALQERFADYAVELDSLRQQLEQSLARQNELRAMVKVLTTVCTEPWDEVEARTRQAVLEGEVSTLKAELEGRAATANGVKEEDSQPSTSAPHSTVHPSQAASIEMWRQRTEEARKERDELRLASAKLQVSLDDANKELASSKAELDEFMAEIEMTGKAFEDMQGQNTRLVTQLAERDEQLQILQSNVVKAHRSIQALQDELQNLQAQLEQREKEKEELQRILDTRDRANAEHRAALAGAVEKVHQLELDAGNLLRDAQSKEAAMGRKDVQLEALNTQLEARKRRIAEVEQELASETQKRRRADEDVKALDRRLARAREVGGDSEQVVEMTQEITAMKRMLICSICNERKNDCIITKCGHLFSRECVQRNIDNRNRKCPKCGIPFGLTDLHDVYL